MATSTEQHGLQYYVHDFWDDLAAPGATDYYWWNGGPWKVFAATIAYLYIVLIAGPRFMSTRPAYSLKWPMLIYNAVLVAINAYLFWGLLTSYNYGLAVWGCGSALSYAESGPLLKYGHLFFHCRYLEFLDTFFFILRKKQSQINFLHVYHHGIVPSLMYFVLKYYPIPFNALLPITNTFVHIVMYGYYALATYPSLHKYLWWKKYLTTMQISQFALLLVSCTQVLLLHGETCKFPKGAVLLNTFIGSTFLTLFLQFFARTYIKSNSTVKQTANGNSNTNNSKPHLQ